MSYHYRCSKANCRKRVALPASHLAAKCPGCGLDTLKRDKAHERESRSNVCQCDAMYYPHRKGSFIFCIHYAGEITDQDYQEFYDKLKRSNN